MRFKVFEIRVSGLTFSVHTKKLVRTFEQDRWLHGFRYIRAVLEARNTPKSVITLILRSLRCRLAHNARKLAND